MSMLINFKENLLMCIILLMISYLSNFYMLIIRAYFCLYNLAMNLIYVNGTCHVIGLFLCIQSTAALGLVNVTCHGIGLFLCFQSTAAFGLVVVICDLIGLFLCFQSTAAFRLVVVTCDLIGLFLCFQSTAAFRLVVVTCDLIGLFLCFQSMAAFGLVSNLISFLPLWPVSYKSHNSSLSTNALISTCWWVTDQYCQIRQYLPKASVFCSEKILNDCSPLYNL